MNQQQAIQAVTTLCEARKNRRSEMAPRGYSRETTLRRLVRSIAREAPDLVVAHAEALMPPESGAQS